MTTVDFCENPWQGSFIIDKLTDIVEEAVYKEFEAISERGGVLGAMDSTVGWAVKPSNLANFSSRKALRPLSRIAGADND